MAGGMAVNAIAGRGALASARAAPQGHASTHAGDKRHRIAISTWSFHDLFKSKRDENAKALGKMLDVLDFPEMIAGRYNVHHVEIVAPHFASTEPAYLGELKGRIAKARSHLHNIPVDIEEIWAGAGLSDPDEKVRNRVIAASKKWIDVAKEVGSLSVRCDPGKINPNDLSLTIDSYKQLAEYGKSKGIYVIIENHGAVGSEHPEELVELFRGVGGDFIGALPDFGNFPDEATRQKGLPLLFPYARTVCHAKGLEFDASGNETKFDFKKCVDISKQAGYKGVYSIEYEGPGDPYEGVQKVVDELMRYL